MLKDQKAFIVSLYVRYNIVCRGCVVFSSCLLVRSFFSLETLIMFRPLVSYFMLAAFFTISTLRLTGLAARGLRYRYGEKIPL